MSFSWHKKNRKRQSLIWMLMMRIAPPTKVIMNLWKKEQLDVWGSLRVSNMIEAAS